MPGPDYPFVKHQPLTTLSRTIPATPCVACHRSFFPLSYALERRDAFLSTLTERLLGYSISGTVDDRTPASRMPAVRAILREAEGQNHSWSALIAAIIKTPLP